MLFTSLLCISLLFAARGVSADSTGGMYFDSGVHLMCPVNETYDCNHIPIYLTFDGVGGGIDYNLTYNLDNVNVGAIPLVMNGSAINAPASFLSEYVGSVNLAELSNGNHRLTIYLEANRYQGNAGGPFKPKVTSNGTVYYCASYVDAVDFYVNTTAVLTPLIHSQLPKTAQVVASQINQTASPTNTPTPTPIPTAESYSTTPIVIAILILVAVDLSLGILAFIKKSDVKPKN